LTGPVLARGGGPWVGGEVPGPPGPLLGRQRPPALEVLADPRLLLGGHGLEVPEPLAEHLLLRLAHPLEARGGIVLGLRPGRRADRQRHHQQRRRQPSPPWTHGRPSSSSRCSTTSRSSGLSPTTS